MKRLILAGLATYLAIGLVFATTYQPQQLWTCPDASQPHGTITYGGLDEAPAEDCRPSRSTAQQLAWFALAIPLWLPLVAAKGLSAG